MSAPLRRPRVAFGVLSGALSVALAIGWTMRRPSRASDRSTASGSERLRLGERIYRAGVLPSGAPLRGRHPGGGQVAGALAACAQCHRRSGLGTFEGNRIIPPIAGQYLFQPRARTADDLDGRHTRGPDLAHAAGRNRPRPPYTRDTLLRALRDGVDSAGHPLDLLMPRFTFDDADAQLLVDYLAQLSEEPSPGVEPDTLRFATVIAPGVEPRRRQAMLDVLSAFFAVRNARSELAGLRERGYRASPRPPHRTWRLDVWDLRGPPDTWLAQLDDLARRYPPFALVSGLSDGEWEPVHAFCETRGVPCWFPIVDSPPSAEGDFYSVYFSGGVTVEAQLLARRFVSSRVRRVIEIRGTDRVAAEGAHELAEAVGAGSLQIDEHVLPAIDATSLRRATADAAANDALVLWLRDADLAQLDGVAVPHADIYASATLAGAEHAALPAAWRAQARLADPFELPDRRRGSLARFQVWLQTRGIALVDERVQADAYLACVLLAEKVDGMLENLTREHLLERAEAILSMRLTPGMYHRLSLGPGQRFASKGGYIAHFAGDGTLAADTDWLIP